MDARSRRLICLVDDEVLNLKEFSIKDNLVFHQMLIILTTYAKKCTCLVMKNLYDFLINECSLNNINYAFVYSSLAEHSHKSSILSRPALNSLSTCPISDAY